MDDIKFGTANSCALAGVAALFLSSIFSTKEIVVAFHGGEFDLVSATSLVYLLITSLTLIHSRTAKLATTTIKLLMPLLLTFTGINRYSLCLISFFLWIWFFITTKRPTLIAAYLLLQLVLFKFFFKTSLRSDILNQTSSNSHELLEKCSANFVKLMISTLGLLVYQQFTDIHVNNQLTTRCKELEARCEELSQKSEKLQESKQQGEMLLLTSSHEFKNALNGLLGSVQMVSESIVEPRLKKILQSANICGGVLKTIVQNLLDIGKFEHEKLEIACADTDMSEFISDFWQVSAELIKSKSLKGFMKVNKNVPANLMIDQQKLLQVLLNLTSNSVKFTKQGHVYYEVDWQPQEDDEGLANTHPRRTSAQAVSLRTTREETEEHEGHKGLINVPRSGNNTKFLSSDSYLLDFEKRLFNPQDKLSNEWKADKKKGFLRISVVDSGMGMNEEDKVKLFKKFSPGQ